MTVELKYQNNVWTAVPELRIGENLVRCSFPGLILRTPDEKILAHWDKPGEHKIMIEQFAYLLYEYNKTRGKIAVKLEPVTLDGVDLNINKDIPSISEIAAIVGVPDSDDIVIACKNGRIYQYSHSIKAEPAAGTEPGKSPTVNTSTPASFTCIYDISEHIYTEEECGVFDIAIAPDGRWFLFMSMPISAASVPLEPENKYTHVNHVYEIDADGAFVLLAELFYLQNCFGGRLLLQLPFLYVATTDELSNSTSQRLDTLHGKILRFEVSTPGQCKPQNSNPFINTYLTPEGRPAMQNEVTQIRGCPEIYAYGLRYPTGLSSIDTSIFCTDRGEKSRESVRIIGKGGNYGWNNYEGSMAKGAVSAVILPIFEYPHEANIGRIVGGYPLKLPSHIGYLFGDANGRIYCIFDAKPDAYQQLWKADLNNPTPGSPRISIRVFGRDSKGKIYLVLYGKDNKDHVYYLSEY